MVTANRRYAEGGHGNPMTDEIYDLAIVGASVMGLSAAFIAASNRPRDRLVIFERDIVGAGASRFAPGIQFNICRNERERQLINHSSKFWQGISSRA